MLNVPVIKQAMSARGLTQAALADTCEVSKEAVSNWLSGDAQPRPRAALALAQALDLSVDEVLVEANVAEDPVVAFRTRRNRAPSAVVLAAAREMGEGFRALLPYILTKPAFRSPTLVDPKSDAGYVEAAVLAIKEQRQLDPIAPVSVDDLIDMHRAAGAILVPVLWGGDKAGHENALHVYLPDSLTSWVVMNLNCRNDDFKFWLAHELGHVHSLHSLRDQSGEEFSERFAAAMLFPQKAAADAYAWVQRRLMRACEVADHYGVSPITIVRELDRYAHSAGLAPTGLDNARLYSYCNQISGNVGTVAQQLFGSDSPSPAAYLEMSAQAFGTPVFAALKAMCTSDGLSAAFIASVLNIGIADAAAIGQTLVRLNLPLADAR